MIQERDEFMAESQHPKTRQVYAECTLQLKRLNDAVLKRNDRIVSASTG